MQEFNKQLFKSYCTYIHFYLCENDAYIWAHVCALVHVEIKGQFDSINSFLKTCRSQGLESGSSVIMEGFFCLQNHLTDPECIFEIHIYCSFTVYFDNDRKQILNSSVETDSNY